VGTNTGSQLAKFVQRLRQGDQSAFLPLYEKTAPGLMRFLLWKTGGDKPLAEDILQEGFVRFLCAVDRLESLEEVSIQAYLMRIVKNCWVDKVARAPHAARPHVSMDALLDLADPDTSSDQERAVELRELAIAMKSLNEKDSQIIWLRDGLGLSHREVADQVGISEQASRQAYVRAKRALMTQLSSTFLPNPERVEGYFNEAT
jgi:RNA polymerase sigma-70 factor, ECF subfamily